jgi:hypothetical protein
LVEQLIRNQQVAGSNPAVGSSFTAKKSTFFTSAPKQPTLAAGHRAPDASTTTGKRG